MNDDYEFQRLDGFVERLFRLNKKIFDVSWDVFLVFEHWLVPWSVVHRKTKFSSIFVLRILLLLGLSMHGE